MAIQGLGGLGHLAIQYARKMGFRTVAVSTGSSKKDFAFDLGATDYIDTSKENAAEALQKMGGASMVVVTAPNAKIMGPLINGIAPTGTLLILARKFSCSCVHIEIMVLTDNITAVGEVPIDTVPLILKGISVRGWPAGHAIDSEDTINFSQVQGVKCLVERFPFNKAPEAVEAMRANKVRFRSVLVME